MFSSTGWYLTLEEIKRIVLLLRETDMSLADIASRMCCSKGTIASVNRKFQIRAYKGKRSNWIMNGGLPAEPGCCSE
jgi:hypothetical protein